MAGIEVRPIGIVAKKEFRERLRNRWVAAVAVIFGVFALAIAYFGAAGQGSVGFHGLDATIASLVSLVIYLVPLIALLLGFDAVVGERERGSLDLLLALPITRLELLFGKFLGLSAALAASTFAGFGVVALILARDLGAAELAHFAAFVGSAILLGMAFLALAMLVSVVARERSRAGGATIALWFFFVLVFDLLLLGGLVATGGGGPGTSIFPYLLLLNPTDVFRILNVLGTEGLRVQYGLATVFPSALASPWMLGGVMVAWIAIPLGFACWRFK